MRKLNKHNRQGGFSLVQTMVGLALSVAVTIGAVSVITQSTTIQNSADLQFWLNTIYYQSVHIARNTTNVKKVLPQFPGIQACLGGKGTNCSSFGGTSYPLQVAGAIEGLNGTYSPDGLCATPNPLCRIRITTNFRWICGTTSCSQMVISIEAMILDTNGNPDPLYRSRSGEFPLNANIFQERGQISYTCKTGSQQTLYGFDYENLEARCSTYDGGLACGNPMRIFGGSMTDNCQPAQPDSCAEGYSTSGLYTNQRACIPARGFWAAGPPAADAFQPYPPAPSGTPWPSETWTWTASFYQTTCPYYCDTLQAVICQGTGCPGNTFWHYGASPYGVPPNPPGTQTTARPPYIGTVLGTRID